MKNKYIKSLIASTLTLFCLTSISPVSAFAVKNNDVNIESYGALPRKQQVDFQKEELTAFIHFGINTFTDREWGDGSESPDLFNPTNLDADQWVSTLVDAGFQKVILTAKHHDGFSLWDTQDSTFDVASSPWENGNGDVVKEVSEACAKYGVKFGVYLSPWDQNSEHYGDGNGMDYNDYYMNQIRELCTNYGDIAEFWMDGAKGSNVVQEYKFNEWYDLIYQLQPDCVIFGPEGPDVRWIGNENGYAGETCWSTIDRAKMREKEVPSYLNKGEENGPDWVVGESDVSIRPGWFYHQSQDNDVKSLEKLMDIYYKSVGRNSILLLNVPPNKEGKLHDNDVKRIQEFGDAVKNTFNEDLALNKPVTTSSIFSTNSKFKASNIVDNQYDSYWAAENETKSAQIEIDLEEEKEFDVISIQEYIPLGQRIKEFNVEVYKNGEWKEVSKGTTIGYKRYVRIQPTVASKIRINIIDSLATPTINNIGVFKQPENIELPEGPPEGLKTINDSTIGNEVDSFKFSSGWVYESKDGNFGNDGHYSNSAGAIATLKFKGSKLYLLGSKDPSHGIMEVSIDGADPIDVDLYSAKREDGAIVFESTDLADGEHTVEIKCSGRKNPNARGIASYVDGALVLDNEEKGIFEFEQAEYTVDEGIGKAKFNVKRKGGSKGRVEINYETIAGTAVDAQDYVRWSGTLAFNEGETEKTVEVTIIDDKKMEDTEHFFIELSDPIGGGILGFNKKTKVNIIDNELIKINTNNVGSDINQFNFSNGWNQEEDGAWTNNKSATFELKFKGSQISLVGAKDPNHGVYQVSIDDGEFIDVSAYSENRLTNQEIFKSDGLSYGEHTLKFKIKGENPNPGRGDAQLNYAIVDASENDNITVDVDFNKDGKIDIGDLAMISKNYNSNDMKYDANNDGVINDEDINFVIDKMN